MGEGKPAREVAPESDRALSPGGLVESGDRCEGCGKPLTGRQKTGCSARCRAVAARRRRRGKVLAALDELERGLEKVRRLLGDPDTNSS